MPPTMRCALRNPSKIGSGAWPTFFLITPAWASQRRSITRAPARLDCGTAEPLHLHRVIRERDRVELLEERPDVVLDPFVVRRLDDELAAVRHFAEIPFFDDD